MYRSDTIVACATPPGRGGVAIVRLSGDQALTIAETLFRPSRARRWSPRRLVHGVVRDPDRGQAIDEGLLVWMPGPHSFTGEDVVELQVHGAPLVVERIVAAAIRLGARAADRGEFTRRAVLNGRIDLLQAEAISDLVDARVEAGADAAWAQLQGALSERLGRIRNEVVEVLAEVEANVDFSDEELPDERVDVRTERLLRSIAEIESLAGGFAAARRLRDGYSVVFTGRPNVGKSSLVNALLGTGRMIVSHEPGTTRDTVEETVDLGGIAFVLTDTAGLRATTSAAEREAIARTRERVAAADILVGVFDRSVGLTPQDRAVMAELAGRRAVAAVNKCDLPARWSAGDLAADQQLAVIETSARTGCGCEQLAARLVELVSGEAAIQRETPAISRVRHRVALDKAAERLRAATDLMRMHEDRAPELVAVELRAALTELAGITEPLDNEEVLDKIFSEFCIGK